MSCPRTWWTAEVGTSGLRRRLSVATTEGSEGGPDMTDGRCRFGPRAKREMVARPLPRGQGAPAPPSRGRASRGAGGRGRIARSMGCSPTTVTTTRDRWLEASEAERASGAWCTPRRPVPRSCPWALSDVEEQRILDARAKTNWGPMRLTWLTGRHRSTIWKVLARHGVSRQRRTERPVATRRYEWTEAGALLHIDAFELPKFERPGHWAHGDRSERHRTRKAGCATRRARGWTARWR